MRTQHKKESLPIAQYGFNTEATQSIPIQEHNRVIEIANGWKNLRPEYVSIDLYNKAKEAIGN